MKRGNLTILVVDDSGEDVILLRPQPVSFPTFVVTDLNMPDGDGCTVLEYLQSTPHSALIPTVALSASTDSDDIKRVYSLGASAYLVKPTDVLVFTAMIQSLIAFWMICEVPEVNSAGVQLYTESTGKLGERFIV